MTLHVALQLAWKQVAQVAPPQVGPQVTLQPVGHVAQVGPQVGWHVASQVAKQVAWPQVPRQVGPQVTWQVPWHVASPQVAPQPIRSLPLYGHAQA